jgi:hypothetical protein
MASQWLQHRHHPPSLARLRQPSRLRPIRLPSNSTAAYSFLYINSHFRTPKASTSLQSSCKLNYLRNMVNAECKTSKKAAPATVGQKHHIMRAGFNGFGVCYAPFQEAGERSDTIHRLKLASKKENASSPDAQKLSLPKRVSM